MSRHHGGRLVVGAGLARAGEEARSRGERAALCLPHSLSECSFLARAGEEASFGKGACHAADESATGVKRAYVPIEPQNPIPDLGEGFSKHTHRMKPSKCACWVEEASFGQRACHAADESDPDRRLCSVRH